MGPHTTPTDRYFTRKEATDLCGTSADTIKRAQGRGRFPGARPRPGCPSRTTEIPYVDLVNAGLYTPPAAGDEPDVELRRIQDGNRQQELTVKVAALEAVAVERAERIKDLDSIVKRLTKVIEQLTAAPLGGGR